MLASARCWIRAQVGPVEPDKLLYRIGLVLHRSMKPAPPWLRRTRQTISLDVVEPTVIGTSDPSLFHPAVEERDAAMRTAIGQKAHSALFVSKQHQIFT